MTSSGPQIGFDRFIHLEWAAAALSIRAGLVDPVRLNALIDPARLGLKASKNNRTVINQLWLEPRLNLRSFVERGVALHQSTSEATASVLTWGVALAAYPFFGKTAELIGRLSALQGDCSSAEILRRMSETYGERETVRRSASRVLQSLASWGFIDRIEKGTRVICLPKVTIEDDALTAWLLEAAMRFYGKAIPVSRLPSLPALFPFNLTRPLAYVVSNTPDLLLASEGPSHQFATLRKAI
jgi:hypothetical protein